MALALPACGPDPDVVGPHPSFEGQLPAPPCGGFRWYADADGDGFGDPASTTTGCDAPYGYVADDTDCDDARSDSHPGGSERCDGFDQDCNGDVDDGPPPEALTWFIDADGDGYGDASAEVVACDLPDGASADATDCDDADPSVNPGAAEACGDAASPVDDDCDGLVDDLDDPVTGRTPWFPDSDGDGFGDDIAPEWWCVGPAGFLPDAGDCDDADPGVYPGVWYPDADEDGFGDGASGEYTCPPAGWVADATDCNDLRQDVSPADPEVCADPEDEDCDGVAGEDGAADCTWGYPDDDGDGYGSDSAGVCSCTSSSLRPATTGGDCDDATADVHPGAASGCDGVDSDCDGIAFCDLEEVAARYTGDATGDEAGASVSVVPDVDGDGVEDLLVGAPGSVTSAGAVYLVNDAADLGGALSASVGHYAGASTLDRFGEVILGCDLDSDGVGDIVMAAPSYDGPLESSGGVFAWYRPTGGSVDALSADAVVVGRERDRLVSAMACGSDVDGDGVPDLVLGAPEAGTGGSVFLLDDPWGEMSVSEASVTVVGLEGAELGAGLAVADLDGDGVDDLAIGAPGVLGLGAVYLLRGPLAGEVDVEDAETRFRGDGVNTGEHVSVLGDTDGDGLPDLAIASSDSAWAAVVRSSAAGMWSLSAAPLTITLATEPGTFATLLGADLDGDGTPELVVGTSADPAVFVFPASGTGALTEANALGIADERVVGGPGGGAVARLADRDGDGADELLVGAPSEDGTGVAWIVQGRYTVP